MSHYYEFVYDDLFYYRNPSGSFSPIEIQERRNLTVRSRKLPPADGDPHPWKLSPGFLTSTYDVRNTLKPVSPPERIG